MKTLEQALHSVHAAYSFYGKRIIKVINNMEYRKTIVKSVMLVLLSVICQSEAMSADTGSTTRYEGSVSAGASWHGELGFGGQLHTSHGVRFCRPGLEFLYIGGSLECLSLEGTWPLFATSLQFHAKASFPSGSRVRMFLGCEAGVMMPLPYPLVAPTFSPSLGVECLVMEGKAVTFTVKTYANPETRFCRQWTASLGFMF